MTPNEVRVIEVISGIFRQKGLHPPTLTAETALDGSLGLESLDFAEMVIRLEQLTGKDPFCSGSFPSIRSISDLARLYN